MQYFGRICVVRPPFVPLRRVRVPVRAPFAKERTKGRRGNRGNKPCPICEPMAAAFRPVREIRPFQLCSFCGKRRGICGEGPFFRQTAGGTGRTPKEGTGMERRSFLTGRAVRKI
ncbi:MAG: hypothetical protein C6P37_05835 [Caldibacillus debilis]|uniref:Uncharacterized protein n=1 Tax=Caldibacillus debilis TaxID=301148 RepID=A0A3E0K5X0_9BACI|nr:MAG: hypothetical protein C6P37_05835 [Caldibacillus debilis]